MAEVAAGLLASPFVKIAVGKLGSAIGEQAGLLWNFRRDLEHMKDTLEYILAALEDAERRSVRDKLVRLWLKRLKNAALDISDMLDNYQSTLSNQATAKMPGRLSVTRNRMALANKMKAMREELRKTNEEFRSFEFTKNTGTTICHDAYDRRETTSYVIEEKIVGRDEDKQTIINLLSTRGNNDETIILPIYGLGGMGKSTLTQLVYNDTKFKKYDHRIWVYVSQDFNLNKIGKKIISQLSVEAGQQSTNSLQMINQRLDVLLHGKNVLIVLDDLWQEEESELEKLKNMLQVSRKGFMIDVIITTRKEDIAKKVCTNRSFKLLPLKHDMCWDIIKRCSQFEQKAYNGQFLQIGLEIAKKCEGVALAAHALGYMLKSKDLSEWSELNKSDIWNKSSSRDEKSPYSTVFTSLMLSYECMPPHLKLCFAYCAIFPKGHGIVQDYLIHQWIALDFIEPSKTIGEEYIKQLLGMSFLRGSKIPSNSKKDVVRYTMHDLVHDLARSIIGDELNVFDVAPKSNTVDQKYCRYGLLAKCEQPSKLSKILPSKLRALHFSDTGNIHLPFGAFSFAKYLRILDFSECSSILFPADIGQLMQLKCLIAPRMQNGIFPECIPKLPKLQFLDLNGSSQISSLPESIGKLGCLIYLNLSGFSSLSKLPESFGDLRCMVHLDMSYCREIAELPDSLANLTNLQHLDLSNCSLLKAIPESLRGLTQLQHLNLSKCDCLARLPEAIGGLVNLQYLNMHFCWRIRELPESFNKLQNLLHLDLSFCKIKEAISRALCGLTALRYLDLSGRGLDLLFTSRDLPDVLGSITNLRFLRLFCSMSYRNKCSTIDVDFIGKLTNLEHLDLSNNKCTFQLPESIGNLKRLHTLNLNDCINLRSLPKSIGAIKLKSLMMLRCPDEVIAQAHSLMHYSLTLPLFIVRDEDAGASSNLHLLEGVNVGELDIYYLEKVRSLKEACTIKMVDKQNLSDLRLVWTHGAYRLLEDKDLVEQLVPPEGLKQLRLRGYSSPSFPSWLISGISRHLPNLVFLDLIDLPTCSSLPPLGQLPNLEILFLSDLPRIIKIDEGLCGGKGAFRRLIRLYIHRLEGLEEWNTRYSVVDGVADFMFPVLDYLSIWSCPRLRLLKPCPPTFRTFHILESDQVISSLEEVGSTRYRCSSATEIGLYEIDSLCQSSGLFHHFPTLQELIIRGGSKLTSLPESMRSLTSLRSLELRSCNSLSALPEWLGDLSTLRVLDISRCPGIKCLPSCVQRLTKLQALKIMGNQELQHWCDSEESKRKLAHINNIIFDDDEDW